MKRIFVCLCGLIALLGNPVSAQVPSVPTTAPEILLSQDSYIRSDRLGITFISSIDSYNNPDRYKNALLLGAGWNRWPLYWNRVEVAPDQWDWSDYDKLVDSDLRNRLSINAILLGRPEFRADGAIIQGIWEPIFATGSDTPREGVGINPNNHWAKFVFEAVSRYKPDGILAKQQRWRSGQGVSVWEVWNEPDFAPFWQGSVQAYARMLKTAYIVIKMVDPDAQVMMGGLLYASGDNWLAQTLAVFQNDGLREQYNWFMDVVAIHSYDDPWRSAWLTLYAKQSLTAYGLKRPIWVNESGVSVWNDYPGPVWANNPADRIRLATAEQQAYYFIMSTAYAWSEGADKVFFHQLYDDCGNAPAGTDFPPNNGEICASGACFGDAFGIYRNPNDSVCFSQHPFGGTARPIANAYRLIAEIFGREDFTNGSVDDIDGKVTVISFERPRTQERILVIWNRTFEPIQFPLTKASNSASMYTLNGTQTITPDADGYYFFELKPATDFNFPDVEAERITAIGGEPIIVVEPIQDGINPTPADLVLDPVGDGAFRPTVEPQIGAVIAPPARATLSPDDDVTPPVPSMQALPATSFPIFTVNWGATDDGEVLNYFVWVRIDGGEWLPWLQTTATQSDYAGESGSTYEFSVWAQDAGGNWSSNTDLEPLTQTRVE